MLHEILAPTLRVVRCSRYGQPLTKEAQALPGKCNPWHHVSGSLSHSVLLSPYHLNTDRSGSPRIPTYVQQFCSLLYPPTPELRGGMMGPPT